VTWKLTELQEGQHSNAGVE